VNLEIVPKLVMEVKFCERSSLVHMWTESFGL